MRPRPLIVNLAASIVRPVYTAGAAFYEMTL
jgi:hypothetical protein